MLKHDNEVIIDFLDIEGMKIIQRNDYFNFSIDSVLIANFATINRKTKNIVDLGTGNGSIPLLLSRRTNANISGIEIQNVSYELAKRNIEINDLQSQIKIIEGNLNSINNYFEHQKTDLVISNPPFFKVDNNSDQLNDLSQLSIARHEIETTLENIISSANYLLKNRGYLALVHRTERIDEILEIMKKYKIYPKRIQFCYTAKNKNSKIVLVEGIKNVAANINVLPPIFTNNENGEYTDTVKKMFKMKYHSN